MTDDNQSNVDNLGAVSPDVETGDDIEIELNDIEEAGDQKIESPEVSLESGIEVNSDATSGEDITTSSAAVSDIKKPQQLDDLDTPKTSPEIPDVLMSDMPKEESLTPLGGNVMSIKKIQNIKVNVQVMLGSVSLSISRLASLKKGELLNLDTSIGDPIDILANGQLIARGEIVVIGEDKPKFGISLVEIIDADVAML